ncbi:hypothetical protein ACL00X_09690 [Aeromonas diversa]|uniref:hypothetical protein n=1 Tax=Aeromonas diversa TaxID=502790 RepID=UPI0039A3D9DB
MRRVLLALLLAALPLRAEVMVRDMFDAPGAAQTLRELYPDLGVSHLGSQLVVSGTPARLAEVKSTLDALDRPPAMLNVEWRVVGEASDQGWQLGLDQGSLTLNAGRRSATTSGHWQVSGLSGKPVRLTLGTTRPVVLYGWRGERWVQLAEEREGIAAVPTLVGERVSVAIGASNKTPGGASRQQLSSELSGRLGEWIELGAISQAESASQLGTTLGQGSEALRQRLQVRVTRR